MRWRIDIEPNHVAQFVDEMRIVRELELANPVRLEIVGAPNSLDGTDAETRCLRHQGADPMGGPAGRIAERQGDDALARLAPERLDTRGPRLVAKQAFEAFFNEPFLPAPDASLGFVQVLDLPVRRMISFAPTPSAVSRTISARQTCFCAALRSLMRAWSRRRSAGETDMDFPARIAQTRTRREKWESQKGLNRQI